MAGRLPSLEKYPGMENGGISADPLLKNLSVCYILWKRNHMTGPEPCGARAQEDRPMRVITGAARGRRLKELRSLLAGDFTQVELDAAPRQTRES